MIPHKKTFGKIGRRLLQTKTKGNIFKPDVCKGLECYVSADFAGGWIQVDTYNTDNVISSTGYANCYDNCAMYVVSKLQT